MGFLVRANNDIVNQFLVLLCINKKQPTDIYSCSILFIYYLQDHIRKFNTEGRKHVKYMK